MIYQVLNRNLKLTEKALGEQCECFPSGKNFPEMKGVSGLQRCSKGGLGLGVQTFQQPLRLPDPGTCWGNSSGVSQLPTHKVRDDCGASSRYLHCTDLTPLT